MERIINAHTNKNDIVLDCFMGSGTTAVACIHTNRQFIGCDSSEEYVKMARDRIGIELL